MHRALDRLFNTPVRGKQSNARAVPFLSCLRVAPWHSKLEKVPCRSAHAPASGLGVSTIRGSINPSHHGAQASVLHAVYAEEIPLELALSACLPVLE